jgi:tetratricopeptide (TPR) repeat protein
MRTNAFQPAPHIPVEGWGIFTLVGVAIVAVACGGGHRTETPAQGVVAEAPSTEPPAQRPSSVVDKGPVVSPDVSYETAESALVGRKYPEAVAMFEAYAARKPDNVWGHYMLGIARWRTEDRDGAQHAFEDALTIDPRHVKSLVNLSRVLLERGQADSALPRIQQAVDIDSGLGEAWRVLGRVQAARGETDSALDAYRTALRIDPEDAWAMNNMGLVLIDAGRYSDAIGPLSRAVQLDSTRPVFANNLGTALERAGHPADAATAYRLALSADSTYAKARVSLSRVDAVPCDSGTGAIDLQTAADEFAREITPAAQASPATVTGPAPTAPTAP